MKKLSAILLTIIISITLSACNNKTNESNQQYEDAMSNGKSSVVEEEYDKAIDYFDLALEAKKDDKEATNLIKQLKLMLEIEESESHGAYFYQMERIDKINAIDTETDVVKKKANDYKEDVLKNIDDSIDYLEEEINDGDYEKAQKDIEDFIKECKKSDSLGEQLDRCEGLLKTCKAEKKKAEEEAKKEAEEQAKKEKEEQQAQKEIEDEWGDLAHDYGDGDVSVFCDRGQHYTKAKNIIISEDGRNVCAGCMVARDYSSSAMNEDCPKCGATYSVGRFEGTCNKCGAKIHSAIKKIKDDGTVIYKDGSVEY